MDDRARAASDPVTIVRVDVDRDVAERFAPLRHRGVEMRMRYRDGGNSTARVDAVDDVGIDERDTVPQDIAVRRCHQQRALTDREMRGHLHRRDAEVVRRPLDGVTTPQLVEGQPSLAVPAYVLAIVLAD